MRAASDRAARNAIGVLKVEDRPIPLCPRCGGEASETRTRYGLRSECCGLWSWSRRPLADAKTHAARKELAPLMGQVQKTMGLPMMAVEIAKRTGIKGPSSLLVGTMNEATARKVLTAVEDIVLDIMSGTLGH